jgi:hypothetical protein
MAKFTGEAGAALVFAIGVSIFSSLFPDAWVDYSLYVYLVPLRFLVDALVLLDPSVQVEVEMGLALLPRHYSCSFASLWYRIWNAGIIEPRCLFGIYHSWC